MTAINIKHNRRRFAFIVTLAGGGAGTGGGINPPIGGTLMSLMRFTVNPITRTVTAQLR